MATLCHLQLTAVHVSLTSLAIVGPQLRTLRLKACPLHASSRPTTFFTCNSSQLEVLELEQCEIDAEIGPVNLPSLVSLDLQGLDFVTYDSGVCERELYDCIGVFAGGCP
jgi:hypothetical protein